MRIKGVNMIGVIGGTGTTGQYVVRLLREKGVKFRCLVRSLAEATKTLGDGVELVEADVDTPVSIQAGLVGCDKLFLLTGHSPVMPDQQIRAIEAAKRAGVSHVVKLSGGDAIVQEDTLSAVGRDHYEIEKTLKSSGLGWTILRPGFFMQNFLQMASMVKEQEAVMMPAPADVQVGMIDARDTAAVAAAVLTGQGHENKIYSLSGTVYTPNQFAAALSKELDQKISFIQIPLESAINGMQEGGMPDWLISQQSTLMSMLAEGAFSASNTNIEKLTGSPPRSLGRFVSDHISVFTA
jgi:uncharacterized protein YbjT (DUF2867 family)